jgi:hypothetical protein
MITLDIVTDYHVVANIPDSENNTMYEWDEEDRQKFAKTGDIDVDGTISFRTAIEYAIQQGWMMPGDYVVRVCW